MLKYSTPLSLDQTPKERKRRERDKYSGDGEKWRPGPGKKFSSDDLGLGSSLSVLSDWDAPFWMFL